MTVALEALFDEIRLSYNQLVQVAEEIHSDESVTLGMRAVLEFLSKNGSATVPEIARSRAVSRQHIQSLVNSLIADGLVLLADNPAHKRSSLVTLTPAGKKTIRRMRDRERSLLERMSLSVRQADVSAAATTLAVVREALARQVNEQ